MEFRPHDNSDKVKAWIARADSVLADGVQQDNSGMSAASLEEAVWFGLKESVDGGWRTEAEAEELYFNWVNKHHGDNNARTSTETT